MTDTPNLGLPLLAAGQAQKHITLNEQIVILDDIVQLSVLDRDLAAPPASPQAGDRYLVAAAPTGAWAGKAGTIAAWNGFGWEFRTARRGWLVWIGDEGKLLAFDGTLWVDPVASGLVGTALQNLAMLGINATADATNRLIVKSAASLFDHAGTDHRQAINRAGSAHTATMIFQTGYSGRAEMGLAGDEQFRFKVSPDGALWRDAIVVEIASGRVSFPFGMPSANLLVNGDFQQNQRGFAGGALALNAYGFDRWKAVGGSATLSLAGYALTLASGRIAQVVEPGLWGMANAASTQITLSVEGLSGGSLVVGIGSASGTITPGSGRRSVTLTTAAGDTGNLSITLEPSGGAATFSRVRLELGAFASAWVARPAPDEQQLCQRYFRRLSGAISVYLYAIANGNFAYQTLLLPVRMRVAPTVTRTVSASANLFANDVNNAVAAPDGDGMLRLSVRSNAAGECFATFSQIDLNAEL